MTRSTPPVAIVTGAGSGIGRATVERLATDHRVAMVDMDGAGLAETGRRVRATAATATYPLEADLRDPACPERIVAEVTEHVGVPALLVNVAGIGVAAGVVHTSDQDWQRVLEVNLTAPFRLTRAVVPLMVARGGGVIINVASVAGLVGIADRAAYCASKAGLIGLSRAVAVDHAADGIRCVAICPGTVETEWISKILADAEDPVRARHAMQRRQLDHRMGTPQEIAAAVAFVAGADGRFVNGSAFVVDGGMTAV